MSECLFEFPNDTGGAQQNFLGFTGPLTQLFELQIFVLICVVAFLVSVFFTPIILGHSFFSLRNYLLEDSRPIPSGSTRLAAGYGVLVMIVLAVAILLGTLSNLNSFVGEKARAAISAVRPATLLCKVRLLPSLLCQASFRDN